MEHVISGSRCAGLAFQRNFIAISLSLSLLLACVYSHNATNAYSDEYAEPLA